MSVIFMLALCSGRHWRDLAARRIFATRAHNMATRLRVAFHLSSNSFPAGKEDLLSSLWRIVDELEGR